MIGRSPAPETSDWSFLCAPVLCGTALSLKVPNHVITSFFRLHAGITRNTRFVEGLGHRLSWKRHNFGLLLGNVLVENDTDPRKGTITPAPMFEKWLPNCFGDRVGRDFKGSQFSNLVLPAIHTGSIPDAENNRKFTN